MVDKKKLTKNVAGKATKPVVKKTVKKVVAKKPVAVFGTSPAPFKPTFADGKIKCNGNEFDPTGDDLVAECKKIATRNGMKSFVIRIDGHTYNDPTELPTNSIAALIQTPEIVGKAVAEVRTSQDVAA